MYEALNSSNTNVLLVSVPEGSSLVASLDYLVCESNPLLARLRRHQRYVLMQSADWSTFRLVSSQFDGVFVQHFHVFSDQCRYLEGLGSGQYHFALFLIATGDDHEAVQSRRVADDAGVVVGAESVSGAMF